MVPASTGSHKIHRAKDKAPSTLDWQDIEKRILCLSIMKWGSGKYQLILKFKILPYKNKQQMYQMSQKLMNLKAIGILHGIRLDVNTVCAYFNNYYRPTKFHKKDLDEFLSQGEKEYLCKSYLKLFQLLA